MSSTDPAEYASRILGIEPTPAQKQILQAVLGNPRSMILSGHGIGKSVAAAVLISWWVDVIGGVALSTAPTQSQVERVLWRSVRSLRRGRNMPPSAPRIEKGRAWAVGYTARDASAWQGVHADRLLIIFDECVGIDAEFWEAAEGMLTGRINRWLALGNPTTTVSEAFRQYQSGRWHTEHISTIDTAKDAQPGMADERWIADMIQAWAEPDPAGTWEYGGTKYAIAPEFQSRVLGEWPSSSNDCIISASQLEKMQNVPPEQSDEPVVIGVDVALFGQDRTVIVVRQGRSIVDCQVFLKHDLSEITEIIKTMILKYGLTESAVIIDGDGIGAALQNAGTAYTLFHANAACTDSRYANRKTESYFRMVNSAPYVGNLPKQIQSQLLEEIGAHTWQLDAKGQRQLCSKDLVKKRIGRSPDLADALAISFATPRRIVVF